MRMIGREKVYESVNILFNADLRPWTADRPAALYFVEHPKIKATFLTIDAVRVADDHVLDLEAIFDRPHPSLEIGRLGHRASDPLNALPVSALAGSCGRTSSTK